MLLMLIDEFTRTSLAKIQYVLATSDYDYNFYTRSQNSVFTSGAVLYTDESVALKEQKKSFI